MTAERAYVVKFRKHGPVYAVNARNHSQARYRAAKSASNDLLGGVMWLCWTRVEYCRLARADGC